ncbi:hypothetical protein ACLBXO_22245 [Methylobacterium sp. C33D]
MIFPYIAAALLGGIVGANTLVQRSPESPFSIFFIWFSWLYIVLNALASAGAFGLVHETNLINISNGNLSLPIQIAVSGIGALAILRGGITVHIAGKSLPINFSNLLQPLLDAADREVRRIRDGRKLVLASRIMSGLNCDEALKNLPGLCASVSNNIPASELRTLQARLKLIESSMDNDNAKLSALGSLLLGAYGEGTLLAAAEVLSTTRSGPALPKPAPAPPLIGQK